jgi:hypothetical protein
MDGEVPSPMDWWVPASCPCSSSWYWHWGASWYSHYGRKTKDHFPPTQWSCFSVLPFSPGPWSNDKVIIWGIFGQPLECYFSLFLHCLRVEMPFRCKQAFPREEKCLLDLTWSVLQEDHELMVSLGYILGLSQKNPCRLLGLDWV